MALSRSPPGRALADPASSASATAARNVPSRNCALARTCASTNGQVRKLKNSRGLSWGRAAPSKSSCCMAAELAVPLFGLPLFLASTIGGPMVWQKLDCPALSKCVGCPTSSRSSRLLAVDGRGRMSDRTATLSLRMQRNRKIGLLF